MNINAAKRHLETIPIFKGEITVERIKVGLSNYSFLITCNNKKFVAKFLNDLTLFHITHIQEVEANKAAHKLNIAPKIMYHDNNVIIWEYIQSNTLTTEEIKEEKILKQIISLLKIVHKEVAHYFRGPAMLTWFFHSVRDYARTLKKINSPHIEKLNSFVEDINIIEDLSSTFEIVFTHGDLFLSNILNDGKKLLLVDWEYSGFNSALTDLVSISKHGGLNQDEENFILEYYYGVPITSKLKRQFQGMKCASLLKETLWSMIAEIQPPIDYNFRQYTNDKLDRYKIEKQKLF